MPNDHAEKAPVSAAEAREESDITLSQIDDWDEYFINLAQQVARKSKDPRPRGKVGAVLVSSSNEVVATGFNGLARGLEDRKELLEDPNGKQDWMVHAEANAILNAARAGVSTVGCTIYVNKFPCFSCLQTVIQAGIVKLYTSDTKYWDDDPIDGKTQEKDEGHWGKKYLIAASGIRVIAPNHTGYQPRPLRKIREQPKESDEDAAPDSQKRPSRRPA